MNNIIQAVDLFCGAGGTSTGLLHAADELGINVDLTAINHWDVAIETHSKNHPDARHLCESLDNVDPRKLFPSGRIKILSASPECTHFSNARGGVPCSDQSRASGWHIVRWAEALYIDEILIENVPEFVNWGPLGADGRPMKSMKGKTFQAFVIALESLGYKCEWRIINTANFGDPTCRRRFFMLCRRGNRRIPWPEYSHSEMGGRDLFGETERWVPARDIIDWSIQGQSIFTRKKPLAKRSLDRIAHGLKKFGGRNAEPFLVMLYGTSNSRSINDPLPTITAKGQHIALCEPFLLPQQAGRKDQLYVRSVDQPLSTIATAGAEALVEPFLFPIDHASAGGNMARSIDKPLPTVITQQNYCLCEPFIVKYYGAGDSIKDTNHPLDTVTTKDRFGLVEPEIGQYGLDIRYRMLQPHELAAAQGFPKDYKFTGNKGEQVKQIGNAVPGKTAKALCRALLAA